MPHRGAIGTFDSAPRQVMPLLLDLGSMGMSLKLIIGPPNSGRAGVVLNRVREALDRDPLLVVPTGEDVATFERDLSAGGDAAIGGLTGRL